MKKLLLFVLLMLGAFVAPASAQQALIVSSCGTLPAGVVYAVSTYGYVTMDTAGKLCDGATGGGGGSVTQGTTPWIVDANLGSNLLNAINGGTGSTGATVPGSAIYAGVNVGGNLTGLAPGTAGAASSQVFSVQGIASMTPLLMNPGTAANWGVGATGSAVPANAGLTGCLAANTEQAAGSNGNLQSVVCGLGGKLVSLPYSVKEMTIQGTGNGTTTGAITVLAANASFKTYVTDLECGRDDTGTTAIDITLNDAKSSVFVIPNNGGGGGNNLHFSTPLVTSAINTALTVTPSSGVTTLRCSAQGYYAN